jgi:hypothetical protein
LTSIEIIFCRRTARYTLFDYNKNEEILEALKVDPVDGKLRTQRSNLLRHVTRIYNWKPKGIYEL